MQDQLARRFRPALLAALMLLFCSSSMAAEDKTSGGLAAGDTFVGLQPGLGSLPVLGRGRTSFDLGQVIIFL